jgi:hypothetical protein
MRMVLCELMLYNGQTDGQSRINRQQETKREMNGLGRVKRREEAGQ